MAVDRVLIAVVPIAPDQIEELGPGVDAAWMFGEFDQEVELLGGQLHVSVVDRYGSALDIDKNRARLNDIRLRYTALRELLETAQQRFHPGEELGNAEGLHEIVVGAELQPQNTIDLRGFRRHHQDRRVVSAIAQRTTNFQPINPGKQHVEDD